MRNLVLKKCLKCGAIVKVIEDCNCENCGIKCCGEAMENVRPNSVDAAFEKHVPIYEFDGENIVVTVNHVMDPEHYIEWIAFVNDDKEEFVYLKPGVEAKVTFENVKGNIYSYCNKHGLWVKEID